MFDFIPTIAAVFSAIAALASAYAAIKGPERAAKLAEDMRQKSELLSESRRLKHYVFKTLMQERARYYSEEAVKAFNLIDVVFYSNRNVRETWVLLVESLSESRNVPDHTKDMNFRALLSEMAKDIGLSELRADDFNRTYYPVALSEEHHLRTLQRQASLRELLADHSPSANTASRTVENLEFPPRPSERSTLNPVEP